MNFEYECDYEKEIKKFLNKKNNEYITNHNVINCPEDVDLHNAMTLKKNKYMVFVEKKHYLEMNRWKLSSQELKMLELYCDVYFFLIREFSKNEENWEDIILIK